MNNNIGKYISKNLCSQKLLDHPKQSATDVLKTASKRAIQKTAEANSGLIVIRIADKITKVSRKFTQNSSETVTNKTENIGLDTEIPRKIYITSDKRQ